MNYNRQRYIRILIILFSSFFVVFTVFKANQLFENLKKQELIQMEIWAEAQKKLLEFDGKENLELPLKIIDANNSIPLIIESNEGTFFKNISLELQKDSLEIETLKKTFINQNKPISTSNKINNLEGKLYYGESQLIEQIKYYPIVLIGTMLIFALLIYFFYRSSKKSEQNMLWIGMAKETAHQISTPLSSIIGWIELLKDTNQIDNETSDHMQSDVNRLLNITDRFSKIGANTSLYPINLYEEINNTIEYLKKRVSSKVTINIDAKNTDIQIKSDVHIISWMIENLVKNAIDAMAGQGIVDIKIIDAYRYVKIHITDYGFGIHKKNIKKVFNPGYTTKKKGWGLGLSLAKRIITEYHSGSIKVLQSTINKGTTMEVIIKR